jgi:sugar phosphate isomerase/epimerase
MALQHGVPILSVHSLLQVRQQNIDSKIIADSDSIRFASEIPTCESIVLHPLLTGPRPSPELNRWLEAISQARADSANPALRLGLENRGENHDGIDQQLLDDLGRQRRLAEEWDLSVTLDIAHASSHGLDLVQAVQTCLPNLVNVHFSDARERSYHGGVRNGLFRDHQVPGEGRLPLADVVATLHAGRYAGPITIELSPASLRGYWPPAARRRMSTATRSVRSMLAAAQESIDWTRSYPHPAVPQREESHEDA